jgi:hypothetical protein
MDFIYGTETRQAKQVADTEMMFLEMREDLNHKTDIKE